MYCKICTPQVTSTKHLLQPDRLVTNEIILFKSLCMYSFYFCTYMTRWFLKIQTRHLFQKLRSEENSRCSEGVKISPALRRLLSLRSVIRIAMYGKDWILEPRTLSATWYINRVKRRRYLKRKIFELWRTFVNDKCRIISLRQGINVRS